MYVDPLLMADVKRAEGCRLTGYPDGGGVPTAGYGHTGPDVRIGVQYTQDQANAWLEDDLDAATAYAVKLPEWSALDTQCRRNALIECVFNLGDGHWIAEFPKTRAALQAQDWQSAAANLMQSPEWIAQVGLGRVQRLANYFASGSYPAAI